MNIKEYIEANSLFPQNIKQNDGVEGTFLNPKAEFAERLALVNLNKGLDHILGVTSVPTEWVEQATRHNLSLNNFYSQPSDSPKIEFVKDSENNVFTLSQLPKSDYQL